MGHPGTAPAMSSPKLLPKKRPVDKKVFLEEELWEELANAARFHTQAFKEMGSTETVSRNDLIALFLGWALDEFWEEKGGKPAPDSDAWQVKAKSFAKRLAAEKKQDS